jgi:hypothetical protein
VTGRFGKRFGWSVAMLLVVAGALVRGQQPSDNPQQTSRPSSTNAEDARVYSKVCSGCHAADTVNGRRSRAQWEAVVEKMTTEGAVMTDPEYEAVMRYLLTRHGRVNVNTATASDLALVLRLSDDDAEKILRQRKQSRLATFEELIAIPGIDAAALTANRSAIEF